MDRTVCLEHMADTIMKTSNSTEKNELGLMYRQLLKEYGGM